MSKRGKYKEDLAGLLGQFLKTDDEARIVEYLVSNSNLPGPRGNIELGEAFAEVAQDYSLREPERIWNLCQRLVGLPPSEAPVNDPKEFLPFCGAVAIGAIASASPTFLQRALPCLRGLASDPRWRTREAVAMGLQRLLEKRSRDTLRELGGWIEDDGWLEMRAVVAAVAEPSLLRDEEVAREALRFHEEVVARILATKERRSDEFRILRQGLGYSLSVVVSAIPVEGFEYMRQLVDLRDVDILWIVKENLKKNRLVKNFPDEVASIRRLLNV